MQDLADLALRASQRFVHRELTERVTFVNHASARLSLRCVWRLLSTSWNREKGCPDGERTIVMALWVYK